MGARYYDPVIGRFLSMDPVEFVESNPASFNRYAYANNNPYMYYDPDGELPQAIVGGAIGGLTNIATQGALILSGAQDGFSGASLGASIGLGAATGGLSAGANIIKAKKALDAVKAAKTTKKVERTTNSAREAAKAQFRKDAEGLKPKVIRKNRDGTGPIKGVGTEGRGGPTYRPKSDGSYSVGRKGDVKHFRPDGKGGHTVNKR